ncbi:MAG: hypothetical protein WD023_05825, partial [Ilumatobacteraceae bacterium]
ERYRGLRAPHKLKLAVSGCTRECAEAQSKDVGVIATERGWNLYVAGNAVLPQSGHNNLTLTAMAFGLRTADRIVAAHSAARATPDPTLVAPPRGGRNHMQRE